MISIPEDVRNFVNFQKLGYVATVSKDGTPNLSPKGTIAAIDESTLVFADIRSPQTIENLKEQLQQRSKHLRIKGEIPDIRPLENRAGSKNNWRSATNGEFVVPCQSTVPAVVLWLVTGAIIFTLYLRFVNFRYFRLAIPTHSLSDDLCFTRRSQGARAGGCRSRSTYGRSSGVESHMRTAGGVMVRRINPHQHADHHRLTSRVLLLNSSYRYGTVHFLCSPGCLRGWPENVKTAR